MSKFIDFVGAVARNLLLGLYVLWGEWTWIARRLAARVTGQSKISLEAYRKEQIARRIQLFSLE